MLRYYVQYRFDHQFDWMPDTSFFDELEALEYARAQTRDAQCEHRVIQMWYFEP